MERSLRLAESFAKRESIKAARKYRGRVLVAISTRNPELRDDDIRRSIVEATKRCMITAHFRGVRNMRKGFEFSLFDEEWAKLNDFERIELTQYYERLAKIATASMLDPIKTALLEEIYAALADKPRNVRLTVSDALGRLGLTEQNPFAIDTQIVTASARAYNAALWTQQDDVDLWGWEYSTAGDERVRAEHRLLDGMRYPKNSKIWEMYAPPNGWRCRCTLIPIYKGEKWARVTPPKEFPPIPPEFRFKPTGIFQTV